MLRASMLAHPFAFASALVLALLPALAVAAPGKDCHLPGAEEALRCLRLDVPLDYTKPGATLSLHVAVAPALRESARRDPLFILAGGPGEAGSDLVPLLNATFRKVRATRDVVLIDQRGTGLSGKLDCPADSANVETMSEEQELSEARDCIKSLNKPYRHYTTEAAARDVDRVRQALGYAQINLWGGSYGTRLAQAYARLFPQHVRAMVLDGVAAPDQVVPAGGRDAQAALDKLFQQCAENEPCARTFPALRQDFAAIVARLDKAPLTLALNDPRTAELREVRMTSSRFLGTVHNILYSQTDSRRLPFLIHSAALNRWQPFIARSNAARDFTSDGPAMALHLAVVCAEDYPRLTPALLAEDTSGSFLGKPQIERIGALCDTMQVPAVPWNASPAKIEAPVLMLSGAVDPVTPPRRAEAAAKYMAHAQHFVVANAGHIVSPLGCAPRLLREFLDQPAQPVQAQCLKEIPTPTFQLNSAGPQP